jgi:hypothetical protein
MSASTIEHYRFTARLGAGGIGEGPTFEVELDGEILVTRGTVASAQDRARVCSLVPLVAPGRDHRDLTTVR